MYICEWLYGCRVIVTDWIGKDADGTPPHPHRDHLFFAWIVDRAP